MLAKSIVYLMIPCLVGTSHGNWHLGDTMNAWLSVLQISGEYGVYTPLSFSHSQRYSVFTAAEGVVDVT